MSNWTDNKGQKFTDLSEGKLSYTGKTELDFIMTLPDGSNRKMSAFVQDGGIWLENKESICPLITDCSVTIRIR